MMDLNNSPFLQNRITQNTQEGFFTIRAVFLLRGMMSTCGVASSMVVAWEDDARAMLKEAVGKGRVRALETSFLRMASVSKCA